MELKDFTQIVCPNCKALVFAEKELEYWHCGHCGEKMAVPQEKKEEPKPAPKVEPQGVDTTGEGFFCDGDTLIKYSGTADDIDIPDYVTRIGAGAFKGNTSVKSVTMHNEVIELGDSAFEDCTMLSEVVLSARLKKIGFKTFNGCDRLRSIKIPASVEQIVYNAMICGLEEIIFENSDTTWEPENEYTSPSFEISRNGNGDGVKRMMLKGNVYTASEVYRYKSLSGYLRTQGVCTRCGGKFGMFSKCKVCGEKKDY